MHIKDIIKVKRKELNLTQEQVATYLGVSAPAVNKWEKGSSYPDITLLAPLARLLKIDLNTLLAFHEELTSLEIAQFSEQLFAQIQSNGFVAGYDMAMEKIQTYPTCDSLIFSVALTLEGALFLFGEEGTTYKGEIEKLYWRVADSEELQIRNQANAMLIARCMERGEYEQAQSLLDTLPDAPVDKATRQALLYAKQDRVQDALLILERRLMGMAGEMQSVLLSFMELILKEGDVARATYIADAYQQMCNALDLWECTQQGAHFQLAVAKKDVTACLTLLEQIVGASNTSWQMNQSLLYKELYKDSKKEVAIKETSDSFSEHFIKGFIRGIQQDEECAFLREEAAFISLVNQVNSL